MIKPDWAMNVAQEWWSPSQRRGPCSGRRFTSGKARGSDLNPTGVTPEPSTARKRNRASPLAARPASASRHARMTAAQFRPSTPLSVAFRKSILFKHLRSRESAKEAGTLIA